MVCNAQSLINLLKSCPSPVHDLQDASIEEGIRTGKIKLHLIGDSVSSALMAYEIQGREFVIVALKSIHTEHTVDLAILATTEAEKMGRAIGCAYVRFHTFRPALVRRALNNGYLPTEFVLRKKIL